MTGRAMQIAFITELSSNAEFITNTERNENSIDMPGSDVIFYWINRAVDKFINNRYTGNNPSGESFEQTQKRMNDLRTLIVEAPGSSPYGISTSSSTIKPNSYTANLPADYRLMVGEEADIQFTKDSVLTTVRQGVTQVTSDRYRAEVDNPFGEHRLQYYKARPLRLQQGSVVLLVSDGNYTVPTYYLRYIKNPTTVSTTVDCDLPSLVHPEVVKLAVGMYLENIMSKRYGTYSNEISQVE